jgi:hypothetical protein
MNQFAILYEDRFTRSHLQNAIDDLPASRFLSALHTKIQTLPSLYFPAVLIGL